MKYRTKLYISLVAVSVAGILLSLVIFSTETEKFIFNMLKSRSLSIAATTAAIVDPELIEESKSITSTTDPLYIKIQNKLRRILNANRREDIFLSDVYLVYPNPTNPKELMIGVETDVDPDQPNTGYFYSDKDLILENHKSYFTDKNFVTDQYGIWLDGFAPIKDKDGKYIATIGVGINAADIHVRLEQLIKYALWGLLASVGLSLLIAHFLSKRVTLSLDHLCEVVKKIEGGDLKARAELHSGDEFDELGTRINAMSKGLQERERLKMSFARYVSGHIMEKIIQSEHPLKLEGERRKVTILFSDIRQFTRLAENLPPEEVVQLLNEYFEQMIEVIFTHSGTLDKFVGDGVMAEFGAPLDDAQQEIHAVRAAIDMQKALVRLCDKWEKENKPRVQMGIGVHTGEAIVGSIGSERRAEYTAIGDTVNVASRLEQATKILNTNILISESTYLGAKDLFSFKDLGSMALPGRKEQIRVYTIESDGKFS